jgi:arylsulfatase A-like enzyme
MRSIATLSRLVVPVALISAVLPAVWLPAAERPNVLVILTDDQGWGDLSLSGNTNLNTPHVDSLARDGASLDRFYVCPVCSPTRAEFLTGRYHPRSGVYSTSAGGERMNLDELTIADTFQAAGYATAAFGKWHNGMQYPYHPNGRGFDEYYGFCSGHWGDYFSPPLEHNGRIVRGNGFVIDDFTEKAMEFMEKNNDRPFFAYLPFNTPHSPMQVPDRWWNEFRDKQLEMHHRDPQRENLPHVRAALAMCENIDWNVARILKSLETLHLADDTIVIYFSDNGPNGWRWNAGMRGKKGSTDEGGVRSPCFARWPKHIKPGTKIPQIAGAIDLLPTLADMAGIQIVGDKPLDGVSVKPLLLGAARDWPDRMIFSHWRGRVSVRTQRYRLDAKGKLYDMVADPGQDRDVSKDHPDVARRLSQAAEQWRAELLPGLGKANRPFPVGYPEFPITHLPARDGVAHGGIRRSARPPNCSFFTHWTGPDDRMTWDIEVATAGRYEAVIYYTCAKEDLGATVELSFGQGRLRAKVTEAHDPPLVGKAHDRTPRGESYVKDFKPLRLGTMRLEAGRGDLTLRAVDIPGRAAVDVRYVVLTLLDSR